MGDWQSDQDDPIQVEHFIKDIGNTCDASDRVLVRVPGGGVYLVTLVDRVPLDPRYGRGSACVIDAYDLVSEEDGRDGVLAPSYPNEERRKAEAERRRKAAASKRRAEALAQLEAFRSDLTPEAYARRLAEIPGLDDA